MFVSCRRIVDDGHCTVEISAENEEELLEAAVEHAYACHAEEDTPALREQIRNNFAACRPFIVSP
jgi:predicted small metal-binding protein